MSGTIWHLAEMGDFVVVVTNTYYILVNVIYKCGI